MAWLCDMLLGHSTLPELLHLAGAHVGCQRTKWAQMHGCSIRDAVPTIGCVQPFPCSSSFANQLLLQVLLQHALRHSPALVGRLLHAQNLAGECPLQMAVAAQQWRGVHLLIAAGARCIVLPPHTALLQVTRWLLQCTCMAVDADTI